VLTSGKVWGEDCIIASMHLQKRWCARAMNYLEVYMVAGDAVLTVARAFPTTYKRIRKLAIRMAVRRQFVLVAKLLAESRGSSSFSSKTALFDKYLDQATAVPNTTLQLQSTLTLHKLEVNSTALVHRGTLSVGEFEESAAAVPSPPTARPSAQTLTPAAASAASEPRPEASSQAPSDPRSHTGGVSDALLALLPPTAAPRTLQGGGSGGGFERDPEVLAAIERTRTELGGQIDALSHGLVSLQQTVADLVARLPPPQPQG